MEKPHLFSNQKEFIYFTLFLLLLLALHLGVKYYSYQNFISKPFYYTYVKVIDSYRKNKHNKSYQVLKLHTENGLVFYTTSHAKNDFAHKRLRLQIFPNARISFFDYLGTFYVKSKIKHQEKSKETIKERLQEKIASEHQQKDLQSFYNAIFFATPLTQALREQISKLGISHLVALSGFHLGILWGLLYGLFYLVYRPFQQKYFPYRYALIDVGMVVIILLGMYVWFVGFPPSLVRSYAMVVVGWSMLLLGVELLSFTFLTTIMLLLLVLFPALLVSLSFWLSVAGVFYIFLLLRYMGHYNKYGITLFIIPLGIFLLMLPVVHGIFGMTNIYQLLSPLLSVLFIPFYPLAMLLHLLGIGDLFDTALLKLFALPQEGKEILLPWWVVLGYIALSIGAIWSRKLFYVVLGLVFGYGIYLFIYTI